MKPTPDSPQSERHAGSVPREDPPSPRFSVVTASWNQGRYIGECLESVLRQDAGDVEHVVVDNCSDDETAEVLAKFSHVRALREPDKGQCDAFNKGVALARGEWIVWLNADDVLFDGALEAYRRVIGASQGIDLIYGHMALIDEDGRRIRTVYHPTWTYDLSRLGAYGLPSTGTCYRAGLLRRHPLDTDFHVVMDTEWALRVGRGLRAKRVQRETIGFRVTEENKTGDHIRTGVVSERHAMERARLAKRYPLFGRREERSVGLVEGLMLELTRKLLRGKILGAKAWSKLVCLRQSGG